MLNFEVSNSCCVESYIMFMGIMYQGFVSNTIFNPIPFLVVTSKFDNRLQ